ncbi:glycosyltransferase family 9 protein [Kineosporia succinea]|uniref:ADP-heptose:LPS heptosyltransferase n=1 Tax=Kineosporia succinea TaxID=84632 RepID=A0ABT9P609_9ACTN|nr:glycosyltransferase family 9 protein [Kineosporia succinea]MDP9827640.1 ADP-heptose:LPS heptosyltransferase [Kineosporia succinea]
MSESAVQGTLLTADESTVESQAQFRRGIESLWPVRVDDAPGPALRRSRTRLSPGMFRRVAGWFSPVVEPADPRNSPLARWARGEGEELEAPKLLRPGAVGAPPRSVLVIRTDEVGDLMMTLPLLMAMRAAWPQARVTLVTRGPWGELLRGASLVDDVVTWDVESWTDSLAGQARCFRFARKLIRTARPVHGRFDLAVLPRRDAEYFGARYIAGAAAVRVVAFDPADRLGPLGAPEVEQERELITDLVCAGEPLHHVVQHGERIAAEMGLTITPDAYDAPGLALISPSDRDAARILLSPLSASTGPLVAVMLSSPRARGVWPAYAQAINQVRRHLPVRVVLLGAVGDDALAEDFVRALNPTVPLVSAVGRAPLRTTLAVLAAADLYLGGVCDTMHLASSVATACVALTCQPAHGNPVSPDAPNRIGPWSAGSQVVGPVRPAEGCGDACVADDAHCIKNIGHGYVARAVIEVLTGSAIPPTAMVPAPSRSPEQLEAPGLTPA